MAQSRVQKGKSKKSKFPMWGIAILVVLVVAISGYAIVRFSQASDKYYLKTADNGLKGGTQSITKESGKKVREVGNNPVFAEFSYDEVSRANGGICADVYTLENTSYSAWMATAGVYGTPLYSYRSEYRSSGRGWQKICRVIETNYLLSFNNLYNVYKTKPSLRFYISEDNQEKGYLSVLQVWLRRI